MKVMILSAGLGTRMHPLTNTTPKPLLKVADKPLIVWHIERLASLGFKEIIINIAHLGYQIPKALGDGELWGVKLIYSDEQQEGALESAGGIIKALSLLGDEPFLVINGDIWTDYKFDKNFRLLKDKLAHLILIPNPPHNINGDFDLIDNSVVDKKRYTFAGIGYYSPLLFRDLEYGKRGLPPILREAMQTQKVTGELYSGEWFDIGTPERLEDINRKFD
ncbi:MAG: nucleotidyltransferase family protein [Sulfurovum sp.]